MGHEHYRDRHVGGTGAAGALTPSMGPTASANAFVENNAADEVDSSSAWEISLVVSYAHADYRRIAR